MTMDDYKVCLDCGELKRLTDYHMNSRGSHEPRCRDCSNTLKRAKRLKARNEMKLLFPQEGKLGGVRQPLPKYRAPVQVGNCCPRCQHTVLSRGLDGSSCVICGWTGYREVMR